MSDAKQNGISWRKGSKYRNVKSGSYASKREAKRAEELKLLEAAGEIRDLKEQVRFPLMAGERPILMKSERYKNGRVATYIADFVYFDNRSGVVCIEDTKGFSTALYKLKRAIMEAAGHRIVET